MEADSLHTLLGGTEHRLNRKLVKLYGFDRAWWLTCMDKWRVISFRCNEVTADGYFAISLEEILAATGFYDRTHYRILNYFKEKGIVRTKRIALGEPLLYKICVWNIKKEV